VQVVSVVQLRSAVPVGAALSNWSVVQFVTAAQTLSDEEVGVADSN